MRSAQHLPPPAPAPAVGLRAELEEYCPAVDRARVEWIDALVDLGECGAAKDEARDPGLVPSAQHQCGAWCVLLLPSPVLLPPARSRELTLLSLLPARRCVWDLREPTRAGWRLHAGDCWERFEEGNAAWCDEWFWQRPRFDLDDSDPDDS